MGDPAGLERVITHEVYQSRASRQCAGGCPVSAWDCRIPRLRRGIPAVSRVRLTALCFPRPSGSRLRRWLFRVGHHARAHDWGAVVRRPASPDVNGPDMTLVIPASAVFGLAALVQRHRVVCPALTVDARHLAMSLDPVPGPSDDVVLTLQRRDVRWMAMLAGMLVMRDAGVPGGGILQMLEQNAMHVRWFGWGEDSVPVPLLTNVTAREVRIHAGRRAVGADALWAAISWYLVGAMMEEYRDACLRAVVIDRDAS